jgi:hypothetical protein
VRRIKRSSRRVRIAIFLSTRLHRKRARIRTSVSRERRAAWAEVDLASER